MNAKADPRKVRLVYHGFDPRQFQGISCDKKEKLVLTVGRVTEETIHRKGLGLFVQSAAYLPNVVFFLVGPWLDNAIYDLRENAPPNVIFSDWMAEKDLMKMYGKAKVYVQASLHEAFGCAVAEASLSENKVT